jgi:predicted NBD/HSP70 family sugar kinase
MSALRGNPARQPSLREHNLALTLAEIADHGPTSRAGLASATGLTKATVSSLVDTLVAGGLAVETRAGGGPVRVGRPGSPVGLAGNGPVGIGLEINVDYLATCTVDLAGTVRQRQLVTSDFRRGRVGAALDRAAGALGAALAAARDSGVPVAGVAVAVPGLVDHAGGGGGLLRLAPNLGWRDVPVLDELRARARPAELPGQPPMTLDNEANRAALGELWCGGHRAADGGALRTFVHVSGEIGVGSGLVVDGHLFRGLRGFSGEIGHLPVATGAVGRCSCGSTGCLEQLAGQEAILRAAGLREPPPAPPEEPESQRPEPRQRDPRHRRAAVGLGTGNGSPDGPVGELVRRAGRGEAQALSAIADAGTALGTGISAVLNLVDADTVVLGGLYARLAPWLRPAVERELAARTLAAAWAPVQVLVSGLGGEAAVRGAAMSVVRNVIADPAGYLASPAATARSQRLPAVATGIAHG